MIITGKRRANRQACLPSVPRAPVLLVVLCSLFALASTFVQITHGRQVERRTFQELQDDELERVAKLPPAPWKSVKQGHLKELLIPRVAGSGNIKQVQNYIKAVFKNLDWHLEQDAFTGSTPIGDKPFVNLVFTHDPMAATKLVIAAHYDSKWFPNPPEDQFVGATDSAAPCAMLLDLAEALTPLLNADKSASGDDDDRTTLQIVFFDGEEAFHDWSATDSIYGSRHLASKWADEYLAPDHQYHRSSLAARRMDPRPTTLSTIEHMVLLDLLGAKHPRILSSYRETDWLHGEMRSADARLQEAELVHTAEREQEWFPSSRFAGWIEDDQVPFIDRGVSVLHVISNPFPPGWHTIKDDAASLDMPTMHRWNLILRVFTMEYLGLTLTSDDATSAKSTRDELVSCFGRPP